MTTDGFLEDGTLLVAMNGAAVSDMPPVFDVDTAVVTEDSSLIAKPVADGDSPPVAGGDVFVATNDDNRKRLARRNSNLTTWGKQARTAVAYALLLAVLGGAAICGYALVQGTWQVTPILSGSMRPGLAVGGVAISQRVPVDSVHVRDVIIFSDPYKPSEQIVHRIVRISKNSSGQLQFNTQGDANPVRDPWTITIRGNDVYRVRWTVPLLGYVANSYQNHRGYYVIGAGVVLILVALVTLLEARQGRTRRHARGAARAT